MQAYFRAASGSIDCVPLASISLDITTTLGIKGACRDTCTLYMEP